MSTSPPFRTAALIAPIVTALAIAGCGGSNRPPNTTSTTGGPKGGIAQAAYRFAACMRDHGSPNFPNPKVSTSNGGQSVAIRVVGPPGKGNHNAIPKPCRGILPSPQNVSPQQIAAQQAHQRAGLLSFAACMRTHGVPNFPDPTSQGRMTLAMITSAGIDLHASPTLNGIRACEGASHGIVTPSVVAQAEQQTTTGNS